MARFSKKKLFGTLSIIAVIVVVGGYFASQFVGGSTSESAAADSTADSTAVAEGEAEENKGPDPVPVEIATVEPRAISSYYHTTATLDPERRVEIQAKTIGRITQIHVEEGAVVKAGAVLCQIEDDEPRIALEEARISRDMQRRELERLEKMKDQNLVSDTEFADRKAQAELAETAYQAAQLKYEYTRVRAPFDGVITRRHVELGQNLTIGTQLFQIADVSPLQVKMYLPEHEVRDVRVGQVVSIRPDSEEDLVLTGRVVRIAPDVDDRTGTVKVTAETNGRARPGSFSRIKIVTDTRRGSLAIPRRGLVSEAGETFVFIAEADSVRKSKIVTGYQDEDFAEVLDGLDEGQDVVVVGMGGLRTGTKIRVLEPQMQNELSRQDTSGAVTN